MPALLSAFEPAARITVATLFNSLWESAVLAIVVALVLRFVPNVNATTRYAAWCVALAGSLLLPLATAIPQIAVQKPLAHMPAVSAQHTTVVPKTAAQKPVHVPPVRSAPVQKVAPKPSFRLPERLHFALPQWLALAIFALWFAAAVLLLVRLALNLLKLERLKSDALPLPVEYRERLERWASADKGEREVRLCVCETIEVPVAVGLFDSMILIPRHLLESLSQSEVDQIILHELAHLRRADDWTNGLQRLIQALFFFNPAVLYIAQQLDLEREVACDDWVVNQTKEVRPYATCLTKMAEATAWPHRPLAAPGVFITRRGLSVRVERLLRAGRDARIGIAFGPTGAIAAALIVVFFVLQNVAPSFAFTVPQDTQNTGIAYKHDVMKAKTGTVKVKADAAKANRDAVKVKVAFASPGPESSQKVITMPAQHIHIPARTVHIPEVNVDMPARRITLPQTPRVAYAPNVHVSIPAIPNVPKNVSETVAKNVSQAMAPLAHDAMNCVGCDFSGQNLSGHSFRGQKMSGSDFSRANLRNADFSNTVLVGADFSGSDLRGANFANAKLTGCDFSHANIDGINFSGVSMVGCDVDARSLPPAQAAALLRGCRTGCDFSYANLSGQSLSGLELTGIDLSHADLHNADLSNVRFRGVDFKGARLDGARVNGAEFTGCDFSGVDLHNVDFSSARITGSKMTADH
jgi:uncharacterized protein YjbI with pentapeptide repeats/beta-lactamase regulating signal transducer with metallopeptidase domain